MSLAFRCPIAFCPLFLRDGMVTHRRGSRCENAGATSPAAWLAIFSSQLLESQTSDAEAWRKRLDLQREVERLATLLAKAPVTPHDVLEAGPGLAAQPVPQGQRQGNGEVPLFEGKCAGCGRWFAVRYRGELPSHGRGSHGGEGEDWCRRPGKPLETRPRKVAPRTYCPECRLEGVQVGALLRCVNPACRVVAFDALPPVSRGAPGP